MATQTNHAAQTNETPSNTGIQDPDNSHAASENEDVELSKPDDYDGPNPGPRTHSGGSGSSRR